VAPEPDRRRAREARPETAAPLRRLPRPHHLPDPRRARPLHRLRRPRDGPGRPAKYLNSPETALFDKGRTLYNHGPAREAAGKGAPLIVAEGYMDVIALSEAGFEAAVAPLGTAITEDQLQLIWRIRRADRRARRRQGGAARGMRLADLALPLLEAGRSLRFAILPEGRTPTT
jgi:DNA primase